MSKNARDLLKQWWQEQNRIARVPAGAIKKEHDTPQESVAAYRAKKDFNRGSATTEIAEARMVVIGELRNWVNPKATLSEELESVSPDDPKMLPNNQAQAVWTDICSIAALSGSKVWTKKHLQTMRIQQLAATINTCKG